MASYHGQGKTNGSGARKCLSWIDSFVKFTDNLETPEEFRTWAAITTIAAALEQKVWLTTTGRLYPNIYCILVAPPGVGKSRTIGVARRFLETLQNIPNIQGLYIAPTSMTTASLVDSLNSSRRTLILSGSQGAEYHSMVLLPDEWAAFAADFDNSFIGNLTTFYDVTVPYEQVRRTGKIQIKIPSPQLSILAGSTPSNLCKYIPDYAWDQGFTSRIVLVYGEREVASDDFDPGRKQRELPGDMVHDLQQIFTLGQPMGAEFSVAEEFREKVNEWRGKHESPRPDHPKLVHYNTRRRAHIYKLAMVSSVDRGNSLHIIGDDFDRSMSWLETAELNMVRIFDEGTSSVDGRAMDEIVNYIKRKGSCSQTMAICYAAQRLPGYQVAKVLDLLVHGGRLAWDQEGKVYRCID